MSSSYETTISVYGPPTPYEFTVVESSFATNLEDEHNPDVPRLKLRGLVDDPDWDDFTIELKVGKNWEVVDEGTAVQHTSGKKQFDGRTQYGKWLDSVVKGQAENPNLATLLIDITQAGEAYEANIWLGRKLVVDVLKSSYVDRETREKVEYGSLIVVDYVGSDDSAVTTAGEKMEAAKEAVKEQIAIIAANSNSHAEFANDVLSQGLATDPDVSRQVMDDSKTGLYEALRGE